MKTRLTLLALTLLPLPFFHAQLTNVPSWEVGEPPAGQPAPTAVKLRAHKASYIRSIELLRPAPAKTAAQLTAINPHLPKLLPGFEKLMSSAEVSSRYRELYARKLQVLRKGELLTAHNYFDCETVLRLKHPDTGRKVLLLQADMDVVTDGSDPLRAAKLTDYNLARSSDWYLPETSYSWGKGAGPANPFLNYYPDALTKLQKLRTQLATEAAADQGVIWREMLKTCDAQIYRIKMRGLGRSTKSGLRARRFLLADRDPFVVLPAPWINKKAAWSAQVGDYAPVIYKDRIYPAVLGDAGPSDKVGEASLRLARALNPMANGKTRAVSDLTVTYLYFPRSRTTMREPDLKLWRNKLSSLLKEIGGLADPESLHDWTTP
jgi:hypothetical protein